MTHTSCTYWWYHKLRIGCIRASFGVQGNRLTLLACVQRLSCPVQRVACGTGRHHCAPLAEESNLHTHSLLPPTPLNHQTTFKHTYTHIRMYIMLYAHTLVGIVPTHPLHTVLYSPRRCLLGVVEVHVRQVVEDGASLAC